MEENGFPQGIAVFIAGTKLGRTVLCFLGLDG
jgi:hypothetical protein